MPDNPFVTSEQDHFSAIDGPHSPEKSDGAAPFPLVQDEVAHKKHSRRNDPNKMSNAKKQTQDDVDVPLKKTQTTSTRSRTASESDGRTGGAPSSMHHGGLASGEGRWEQQTPVPYGAFSSGGGAVAGVVGPGIRVGSVGKQHGAAASLGAGPAGLRVGPRVSGFVIPAYPQAPNLFNGKKVGSVGSAIFKAQYQDQTAVPPNPGVNDPGESAQQIRPPPQVTALIGQPVRVTDLPGAGVGAAPGASASSAPAAPATSNTAAPVAEDEASKRNRIIAAAKARAIADQVAKGISAAPAAAEDEASKRIIVAAKARAIADQVANGVGQESRPGSSRSSAVSSARSSMAPKQQDAPDSAICPPPGGFGNNEISAKNNSSKEPSSSASGDLAYGQAILPPPAPGRASTTSAPPAAGPASTSARSGDLAYGQAILPPPAPGRAASLGASTTSAPAAGLASTRSGDLAYGQAILPPSGPAATAPRVAGAPLMPTFGANMRLGPPIVGTVVAATPAGAGGVLSPSVAGATSKARPPGAPGAEGPIQPLATPMQPLTSVPGRAHPPIRPVPKPKAGRGAPVSAPILPVPKAPAPPLDFHLPLSSAALAKVGERVGRDLAKNVMESVYEQNRERMEDVEAAAAAKQSTAEVLRMVGLPVDGCVNGVPSSCRRTPATSSTAEALLRNSSVLRNVAEHQHKNALIAHALFQELTDPPAPVPVPPIVAKSNSVSLTTGPKQDDPLQNAPRPPQDRVIGSAPTLWINSMSVRSYPMLRIRLRSVNTSWDKWLEPAITEEQLQKCVEADALAEAARTATEEVRTKRVGNQILLEEKAVRAKAKAAKAAEVAEDQTWEAEPTDVGLSLLEHAVLEVLGRQLLSSTLRPGAGVVGEDGRSLLNQGVGGDFKPQAVLNNIEWQVVDPELQERVLPFVMRTRSSIDGNWVPDEDQLLAKLAPVLMRPVLTQLRIVDVQAGKTGPESFANKTMYQHRDTALIEVDVFFDRFSSPQLAEDVRRAFTPGVRVGEAQFVVESAKWTTKISEAGGMLEEDVKGRRRRKSHDADLESDDFAPKTTNVWNDPLGFDDEWMDSDCSTSSDEGGGSDEEMPDENGAKEEGRSKIQQKQLAVGASSSSSANSALDDAALLPDEQELPFAATGKDLEQAERAELWNTIIECKYDALCLELPVPLRRYATRLFGGGAPLPTTPSSTDAATAAATTTSASSTTAVPSVFLSDSPLDVLDEARSLSLRHQLPENLVNLKLVHMLPLVQQTPVVFEAGRFVLLEFEHLADLLYAASALLSCNNLLTLPNCSDGVPSEARSKWREVFRNEVLQLERDLANGGLAGVDRSKAHWQEDLKNMAAEKARAAVAELVPDTAVLENCREELRMDNCTSPEKLLWAESQWRDQWALGGAAAGGGGGGSDTKARVVAALRHRLGRVADDARQKARVFAFRGHLVSKERFVEARKGWKGQNFVELVRVSPVDEDIVMDEPLWQLTGPRQPIKQGQYASKPTIVGRDDTEEGQQDPAGTFSYLCRQAGISRNHCELHWNQTANCAELRFDPSQVFISKNFERKYKMGTMSSTYKMKLAEGDIVDLVEPKNLLSFRPRYAMEGEGNRHFPFLCFRYRVCYRYPPIASLSEYLEHGEILGTEDVEEQFRTDMGDGLGGGLWLNGASRAGQRARRLAKARELYEKKCGGGDEEVEIEEGDASEEDVVEQEWARFLVAKTAEAVKKGGAGAAAARARRQVVSTLMERYPPDCKAPRAGTGTLSGHHPAENSTIARASNGGKNSTIARASNGGKNSTIARASNGGKEDVEDDPMGVVGGGSPRSSNGAVDPDYDLDAIVADVVGPKNPWISE